MSEFRRRLMMAAGEKAIPDYLCFTALEDGTFTLSIPSGLTTTNLSYVEYSIDGGISWTKTDNVDEEAVDITTPTILEGNTVLWRGSGIRYASSTSVYSKFTATGTFNASGHLQSLCNLGNIELVNINSYRYFRIFYGNKKLIDAGSMLLPTSTASYSIAALCRGCSNLVNSPVQPALRLESNSFREGYYGCSSLKRITNYATSTANANAYYQWTGASSAGKVNANCLLVCNYLASTSLADNMDSYCKAHIFYDIPNDKYYLADKTTECDENGNPI